MYASVWRAPEARGGRWTPGASATAGCAAPWVLVAEYNPEKAALTALLQQESSSCPEEAALAFLLLSQLTLALQATPTLVSQSPTSLSQPLGGP